MREIKFQGPVQGKINRLVEALDDRLDVDIAIRLALKEPERGELTTIRSDYTIHAINILGRETWPDLVFYYIITPKLVLVVDVKSVSSPEE